MISEADFADLVASAATDVKKIIRVEDRLVLYVCVCACPDTPRFINRNRQSDHIHHSLPSSLTRTTTLTLTRIHTHRCTGALPGTFITLRTSAKTTIPSFLNQIQKKRDLSQAKYKGACVSVSECV
jgi:hypothetical protein